MLYVPLYIDFPESTNPQRWRSDWGGVLWGRELLPNVYQVSFGGDESAPEPDRGWLGDIVKVLDAMRGGL